MTPAALQSAPRGSAAPKARIVLIPFDMPDHVPAWTAEDETVLEAAILAALRREAAVTVSTAPSTTETPRDRVAIARAARALMADYLLEGGVTEYGTGIDGPPDGSTMQITFQLFDGRTGALVWVDEANASTVTSTRAAAVREMAQVVARAVADRVAKTSF
jgi:TolB-like protein